MTRGVFVMVAGIALWAVPSTAGAHAGNNDPQLLHVCIGKVSKVVRSVGVSGVCITGPPVIAETADHWRKAGEKGDKGDKGDSGTNGIKGIDGTSVTFGGHFSGTQNGCPNGGAIYATGNPPVNTFICHGTNGIDGQAGGDGRRADGPCFDNANRYVNCLNGTVTDTYRPCASLALRLHQISSGRGLSPPSCQTYWAHPKRWTRRARAHRSLENYRAVPQLPQASSTRGHF